MSQAPSSSPLQPSFNALAWPLQQEREGYDETPPFPVSSKALHQVEHGQPPNSGASIRGKK